MSYLGILDFTIEQAPPGSLRTLPLGVWRVDLGYIDYEYKNPLGRKVIHRYHRGELPKSAIKRQQERLNETSGPIDTSAISPARLQSLPLHPLPPKSLPSRALPNQYEALVAAQKSGQAAQNIAGARRRNRKKKYRNNNQVNVKQEPVGSNGFVDYEIGDNPQLRARAVLRFQAPEPMLPPVKQEETMPMPRAVKQEKSDTTSFKGFVASNAHVIEYPKVGESDQPFSDGTRHALIGQKSLPSFGNFQFQAPNLQGSPFKVAAEAGNGSAAPSKTESLSMLHNLPAFKRFIPPTLPTQPTSPGYLPPSLSLFGITNRTKLLFEPSKLSLEANRHDRNSPASSSDSSAYADSSWSSPVGGESLPRPSWNFNQPIATTAPFAAFGGALSGIATADRGRESSFGKLQTATWLKKLPDQDAYLPYGSSINRLPPPKMNDRNEIKTITHNLPTTSTVNKLSPPIILSLPFKKLNQKENMPLAAAASTDVSLPAWDSSKCDPLSPLKKSLNIVDQLEDGEIVE